MLTRFITIMPRIIECYASENLQCFPRPKK